MDELSNITCALKEELKAKIGVAESTFNLWFGDLHLTDLDGSVATFSTPTKIRKQILSTRFSGPIKEALEQIIGFSVEIKFFSLDETIQRFEKVNYDEDVPKIAEDTTQSLKKEQEMAEILSNAGGEKKTILDEYTFDNFIEGESNKFAKAACYAVANEPCLYNPLFIHGHSGLGKTHLLYAIMNHMKKNNPELKIVYKKSETFINELIEAIGDGLTAPFKEKYRSADVLMIDDIQFIAGKESTQEEFFHTFSALYESEKQIILTSDRPPMEIKPLTDRLRTRFEGGLIADVQPPSFELRTAIIRKKSDAMGLSVSPELVDYMADRLNNNIRQIEGVLKKLYAIISLTGAPVTKESIDNVISIVDPGNVPTDIMIERIITAVSKKYGVPVEDIKSKKKTDNVANARHVAIYIIKKLLSLSYPSIGQIFERDHSTVISSVNKVELNIRTKNGYEAEIQSLIKEIKGN